MKEKIGVKTVIDESVIVIEEVFREIRRTNKVPLLDIRRQMIQMIHQTVEQPNLFEILASLQCKDDYTYRHIIGVAVMATLIGKWLGVKGPELMQLTMAATIHDVGKAKIPVEILNNPGKLTKDEFALFKKHTIFGYQMIKETVGTNHRQALVALQHHERQDGSGYPLGVGADKIDLFSRIVAVADVFHAMSSNRSYRTASPFYETLNQMQQNAFGALDARIIHILMNKIMQSLVGNDVILTDGRTGSIIMINTLDPIRPLVRVEESFVDLSKQTALHIEQVV